MRGKHGFGQSLLPQGLALSENHGRSAQAVRERIRRNEVSTRKQVGDPDSMMNEERPGGGSSSFGVEEM